MCGQLSAISNADQFVLLINLYSLCFFSDVLGCITVTQETTSVGNILCCGVLPVNELICKLQGCNDTQQL